MDARVASSVGGVNGDADTGATTDDMNRYGHIFFGESVILTLTVLYTD